MDGCHVQRKHKHKYGGPQLSCQKRFIILFAILQFAEEFLVSAANVQYNIDRDQKKPVKTTYTSQLRNEITDSGSRGGYSPIFWVGVCRTVLKTLTLFQSKMYDFSYPFSDLTPKIYASFETSVSWDWLPFAQCTT